MKKSQKVFDEVGYNISEEAKSLILSIDKAGGNDSREVDKLIEDNSRLASEKHILEEDLAKAHKRIEELEEELANFFDKPGEEDRDGQPDVQDE